MIQLPNDVVSKGYKKTGVFEFEQVFSSASAGYVGTDKEFVQAGHAYEYRQISAHSRVVIGGVQ